MAVNGECTLSELTKELHISVPTITKLVQELIDDNIVNDLGKVETPGGRRPNVFGLANSAIYFAGVNVARDNMTFVITNAGGAGAYVPSALAVPNGGYEVYTAVDEFGTAERMVSEFLAILRSHKGIK